MTVGCPYDASSHTNYQNKEINIDVLLSSNPQTPSLTNCPNSDTFNYHILLVFKQNSSIVFDFYDLATSINYTQFGLADVSSRLDSGYAFLVGRA